MHEYLLLLGCLHQDEVVIGVEDVGLLHLVVTVHQFYRNYRTLSTVILAVGGVWVVRIGVISLIGVCNKNYIIPLGFA